MCKEKIRTQPNLSDTSINHQAAIAMGKDHYSCWQYNVADRFKDSTPEEVKSAVQATANPFAVCFEHWIGDFNMGTGVRNANAFNAEAVYYVGDKKWDKRSAVGVYNYTPVNFLNSIDELMELQEEYLFVGIDNVSGSVPIQNFKWRPKTMLIFGEEGCGLTSAMQALCHDIVEIPMFGSVRSMNCGTASGIVMYDFVNRVN